LQWLETMKKAYLLIVCVALFCSLLVLQLLRAANTPNTLHATVEKAIDFIEDTNEPHALLWLDVMHRRFGITAFANALQRYDLELAHRPDEAPLLRIFRRIADYENQLQTEDLKSVLAETDGITVPALYCDRIEFPDDYSSKLVNSAAQGGYKLTHVLLALIWTQENNCSVPLPLSYVDQLYLANAALIDDDSVVTDLELEAAAFLYFSGHGSLVDQDFPNRVITAQNGDGGWSLSSKDHGNSYWHSTIVGLLLLLHLEYPAQSYEPTISSKS